MSSLFSSPSKQATAAAQASQQISQQDIQQLEDYISGQQGQLRTAIGQQGPNPYFGAAQQLNPQAYYTNPNNTVTYGAQGPGTTSGRTSTQTSQPGPPALPNVILGAPPAQTPPRTGTGGGGGGQGGGGNGGNGPINPITGLPVRIPPGRAMLDVNGNPLPTPADNGEGPIQNPLVPPGQRIPPRQVM